MDDPLTAPLQPQFWLQFRRLAGENRLVLNCSLSGLLLCGGKHFSSTTILAKPSQKLVVKKKVELFLMVMKIVIKMAASIFYQII